MHTPDPKHNETRVFLIDDHPIVRKGIRSFLTSRAITVAGEASNAREAIRKIKKLAPDVIILEVNLPSLNGGHLARLLHRLVPKAKILVFSSHSSEEYILRMARCGARGYVSKDSPTHELLEAISHVSRGGLHFPAGMTGALLEAAQKHFLKHADKAAPTGPGRCSNRQTVP